MQRFVSSASEQFIDSQGKCRALIYNRGSTKLTLFISPIVPSDLPVMPGSFPRTVTLKEAVSFCKDFNLDILEVYQKDQETHGLNVKSKEEIPELTKAHIPIAVTSDVLKNIPITEVSGDPFKTTANGALDLLRLKRKVATILQAYVLWTYSRSLHGLGEWKVGEEFEIVKTDLTNYSFELAEVETRLFFEGNDIIYSKGKIKVVSLELADSLRSWLKIKATREPSLVENYWERKTIPDLYKTISDFRSEEKQIIFVNKSGLELWIKHQKNKKTDFLAVSNDLDLKTPEPYFYRWGNSLVLLQNVRGGSKELAQRVASRWFSNKDNPGYNPLSKGTKTSTPEVIYSPNLPKNKTSAISEINKTYFAVLIV